MEKMNKPMDVPAPSGKKSDRIRAVVMTLVFSLFLGVFFILCVTHKPLEKSRGFFTFCSSFFDGGGYCQKRWIFRRKKQQKGQESPKTTF